MVQSQWNYSPTAAKFCYDKAFDLVKSTICEVFAGPAKHGIHSASLQKTLYDTERLVLERVPQVTRRRDVILLTHLTPSLKRFFPRLSDNRAITSHNLRKDFLRDSVQTADTYLYLL